MDKKLVYLDHAATTYVKQEVLEKMIPYFTEKYGNPSSVYKLGRENKQVIEEARRTVAECLGASPTEIFFTGSGTESDNWAILGCVYANAKKGKHIITSQIEHPGVLNTFKYLEKQGFEVTYLPVDEDGVIDIECLKRAVKEDTIFVSIMYANNELGTIQSIADFGFFLEEKGIVFHTDAVQAGGHIPIDVKALKVNLLSLAAHKFYGPKGVGILYMKKGTKIQKHLHGGGQERRKRPGTENVPGIVGAAEALKLASENMDENNQRILKLSEYTIDQVFEKIPEVKLNGHREKRIPGTMNFSFRYIEGEGLLLMLDMKGIMSSSGSACSSGSLDPSHVLLAIGLSHEIAHGSLRVSLGDGTTKEEIDYFIENLVQIVDRLRQMSPLYKGV